MSGNKRQPAGGTGANTKLRTGWETPAFAAQRKKNRAKNARAAASRRKNRGK